MSLHFIIINKSNHNPQIFQPAPRAIRNRNNKFGNNITKRGNVSVGKAAQHDEENRKMNPYLVGMFVFLVVGSSAVQVLRLFQSKPAVSAE